MFNFEKLDVWQKVIDFADFVYVATRAFPDEERFGLTNQMSSNEQLDDSRYVATK